ncbi:acyl-CoA dehydrogenase family protein [Lipingzhangella sp. LS1_29]|uniref:Acyl-CoA dehydrogenase family protein n=1 Tax=Lipingzhangella rawalii TaxID=2055835 RepID=A0ABU2H0N9_9ACTN|nr:acyl-CoA dehydrogenase family protein [Lipingzhangella rawalii]MDS1268870.1 acyl-CoA dehydrogenase family protein [Lipingzhangella rawalii]
MPATHEVRNQPPPLEECGYNLAAEPTLVEALDRTVGTSTSPQLEELGRLAASPRARSWAEQANTETPVLRTHDRFGHRLDEVDFHPSWHVLCDTAVSQGLQAAPWAQDRPWAHLERAARFYVWSQVEGGHGCPMSMTYAIVPALRHSPELAERYEPLLCSTRYDFGLRPPEGKQGLLAGMSMTEKQGGSDVRSNTTRAVAAPDGTFRLTGHKWFTSAPMSDLFLTLAQTEAGLSCFLVPRVLPDGTRNAMFLQRLKNKLGNRSNASAEVEYADAVGYLVGDAGRGLRVILEMVNSTRLDCVLGSAAGMRMGLVQALHHARHREAFGGPLVDAPLMRNVLADLALESQAATALALRLAEAADRGIQGDEAEANIRRIGVAVGKYWVTKRLPGHAAEALECLGGNGYVEESGMPLLFRESPLNSIWEGSGNVAALDVLRAMARSPEVVEAYFTEVDRARGASAVLDAAVKQLRADVADPQDMEYRARDIVERMALCLQGALLVRHAPGPVADTFVATRLGTEGGHAYGTLPRSSPRSGTDVTEAILERSHPRT